MVGMQQIATPGLLDRLDREELQGVIGHELAHVANYDIRFSLLVGVLVGSIALLADILARMTFWGSMTRGRGGGRSGGGGGGHMIIFFIGLLVAILAPLFARLVQMAVNRQREYLADASAARYTRYPLGLASALADDPPAEARRMCAMVCERSPDAVAAVKRLFRRRWTSRPGALLAHETFLQARILAGRNQRIATRRQQGEDRAYLPRGRW